MTVRLYRKRWAALLRSNGASGGAGVALDIEWAQFEAEAAVIRQTRMRAVSFLPMQILDFAVPCWSRAGNELPWVGIGLGRCGGLPGPHLYEFAA